MAQLLLSMAATSLGLFVLGFVRAVRRAPTSRQAGTASLVAAILGFGAAGVASAALLVLPVYSTITVTEAVPEGPPSTYAERRQTLLEVNGPGVLIPVALPPLIAGLALTARRGRWWAAALAGSAAGLSGFALLTGFSIGLAYLPSALLLGVAAVLAAAMRTTAT